MSVASAADQAQPRRGPLAGLRVLELGTLIAGPFATRLLAEFGADVIKVEDPRGGDPLRSWRVLHQGTSLWWSVQARNKRSVTLDLRQAEAREIARRLALEADVVVENYRPGVLEKWGLGWKDLSAQRPSLVMVRISGFGQTGPRAAEPGFGAVGEAMGGLRQVSGFADRPPVRIGVSMGDSLAALHAVMGALMALRHRDATGGREAGQGQLVDVALYESVFNLMESTVPEYAVAGVVRGRTGASLPGIVPSNTYLCADGAALVVAGNGDAIFHRLMLAIGRDDLARDSGLASNEGRVLRAEEIDSAIGAWCASRPIDEAIAVLAAAEVPASRIYSVADMFADPQFAAREMIETHVLADGTPIAVPAASPKLSATPGATRWLGPRLGEHTEAVLAELGYSSEDILKLQSRRII